MEIATQLAIFLANQPGALAKVGVNIDYLYCSTARNANRGLLVLRVSDAPKALKALSRRAAARQ